MLTNRSDAAAEKTDFVRHVTFRASRDRVFDAIATMDGVRGWWSTDVTGSTAVGDILRFGFQLSEHREWIVMRVDTAAHPSSVRWTCVAQFVAPRELEKNDEWIGTTVTFDLSERAPESCELRFRHIGLNASLECYAICEPGWDHFLASLVAYVEEGKGMPFGV